jgi:hypothetical protein
MPEESRAGKGLLPYTWLMQLQKLDLLARRVEKQLG